MLPRTLQLAVAVIVLSGCNGGGESVRQENSGASAVRVVSYQVEIASSSFGSKEEVPFTGEFEIQGVVPEKNEIRVVFWFLASRNGKEFIANSGPGRAYKTDNGPWKISGRLNAPRESGKYELVIALPLRGEETRIDTGKFIEVH